MDYHQGKPSVNDEKNRDDIGSLITATARPRLAAKLPGVGGIIKESVEDFQVTEVPAYEPCGEGPHHYLWVESRDIDGRELLQKLAAHFGVARREIGTAGTKDKRAVTRQWVSLPAQLLGGDSRPEPEGLDESVEILDVSRHGNKLRTGHLKGNRFSLVLRQTTPGGQALEKAAGAIAEQIAEEGLPNYYGLQRFGNDHSNLIAGWKWAVGGAAPKNHFLRRMAASALQSEIFNRVLARRLDDGTWKQVIDGDIFMRLDSGGRFWIQPDEREETARRLAAREIVVTGPMPGSKGGLARERAGQMELEIMDEMGLDEKMLGRFGRHAKGTRRALTVYPEELNLELADEHSLRLDFFLPAGSYATVLLREFIGYDE